jgi:hypothetical protein
MTLETIAPISDNPIVGCLPSRSYTTHWDTIGEFNKTALSA